ncbi:MAG: trimethylamine methyltransferase family protein [Spirochaetota bacterium]|nr:MAG: trimethylamine methyltransferase family protein [Spirochaetota bacterium]
MFAPLKKANVEKIHSLSLKILNDVGIEVESKEARTILKNAGARISPEEKRVYIPASLVEDALKKAPSSFAIYGRKKEIRLDFKRGSEAIFGGSGVPSLIHDPEDGTRRDAKLKDFISVTRLFDGLSNVDLVTDSCTFVDVAGKDRDITALFHLANNTRKPLLLHITFTNEEDFDHIIEMTNILKTNVFSGNPFIIFRISPMISPLRLDKVHTNHLIKTARADIPVCPVSAPQAGMSAPASLAGTLSMMNAEVLALLVMSQCANPEIAFLYGPFPEVTNFMTGNTLVASPEAFLLNIAANQLAEFYNLPNWTTVCRTDSKILDIQTGYESSFGVLLISLCRPTYVSAVSGLLESSFCISLEKIVIDDEIVGMVKRVMKGIDTGPDHYAYELISSIGPGGNFLAEEHTVEYMRKEFFIPRVSELSNWNKWASSGKPTALTKAKERVKQIVASHSTSSLSDSILKQIKDVMPDITLAVN